MYSGVQREWKWRGCFPRPLIPERILGYPPLYHLPTPPRSLDPLPFLSGFFLI